MFICCTHLDACECLQVVYVESFINSVDSQMRQRQEQQKLAAISARVESYEAVEGASEEVEKVRTLRIINHLEMHCFVVIYCWSWFAYWKFGFV